MFIEIGILVLVLIKDELWIQLPDEDKLVHLAVIYPANTAGDVALVGTKLLVEYLLLLCLQQIVLVVDSVNVSGLVHLFRIN